MVMKIKVEMGMQGIYITPLNKIRDLSSQFQLGYLDFGLKFIGS
jgi:hypothetical protein